MKYLRVAFIGISAVIGTWIVLAAISMHQTSSKATGLAVVARGALESLFSPLFWIVAVSLFFLLLAASRAKSTPLRVLFYWLPAAAIWTVILAFLGLIGYVWMRSRQG